MWILQLMFFFQSYYYYHPIKVKRKHTGTYLNISLTVPLQGTEHQTRGFSSICWRWICALPCRQDLAIPAMPHLLVTSLVIDKKQNPIQMVTKLTSLLYVAIPCYYNQLQAVMRRTSIIGQLLTRQLVWLLLLGHTDLAHLAPA